MMKDAINETKFAQCLDTDSSKGIRFLLVEEFGLREANSLNFASNFNYLSE